MRRSALFLTLTLAFAGPSIVAGSSAAEAAGNAWPQTAVNGFSTPNGGGFWLLRANGAVSVNGNAHFYGDASGLSLNGPIIGGR